MVLFLINKRFNVRLFWADYYLRWWRLPIEERAGRKTDLGGGDYYWGTLDSLPHQHQYSNIYTFLLFSQCNWSHQSEGMLLDLHEGPVGNQGYRHTYVLFHNPQVHKRHCFRGCGKDLDKQTMNFSLRNILSQQFYDEKMLWSVKFCKCSIFIKLKWEYISWI